MAEMTKEQRARLLQEARNARLVNAAQVAREEMQPSVAEDVGKSVASGLGTGAVAVPGFFGDMLNLPFQGGAYLAGKIREWGGGEPMSAEERNQVADAAAGPMRMIPTGSEMQDAAASVVPGLNYEPQTTAGEYAQTAAEFVPSAVAFGGPKAALQYGVTAGLGSEAAGQMMEGQRVPESLPLIGGQDAEPYSRVVGALLAPGIYGAARRGVQAAVTPNPADPARTKAAQVLDREGIRTTAGQRTGNAPLRYREDAAPRTQQIVADQGDDFTRAALRRIGVEGNRADPEVLRKAADDIGSVFSDVASRNNIRADSGLFSALKDAKATYESLTAKSNIAPAIRNIFDDIGAKVISGEPITGQQYQSWRSQLSRVTTGNDAQLRGAAIDYINALDDAMVRSAQIAGRSADVELLQNARRQWANLKSLEKAASSAGSDAALGIINPRQLRSAVATGNQRSGYAQGRGDLSELARAGNAVMTPLPQSGTQPRLAARTLDVMAGSGSGIGSGSLAYLLTKDPNIAAAAGVAGSLAPAARNQAMASRVGQAYLANQLLPNRTPVLDERMRAVAAALLAQKENSQKQ